ncbi:GLPGLI family protein [Psychroflexus torquis]|nr:GLPGLI family protein [Psychroflexus torquis]
MQKILVVVFGLFYFVCMSQSGSVNYKVEPIQQDQSKQKEMPGSLAKIINKLNKQLKYVDVVLEFNAEESIFKVKESMNNDATFPLNDILRVAKASGDYYTNKSDGECYKVIQFQDKDLSIVTNTPSWEITKETKTIQGYQCFKATTTFLDPNESESKVTAWFVKDLPYAFGPKKYFGLPGLILEIEDFGYRFYATKIDLSENGKDIENPVKGKILTEQDYFAEGRAMGNPYKN